jgi:2-polyprenyl-3-methyl-5-hydroxy-6-metoxy-1,4-benzoquinol methylase
MGLERKLETVRKRRSLCHAPSVRFDLAMRVRLLRLLGRLGLLAPAYRAYERARALRGGDVPDSASDGLPLPPAALRIRVAGTPDSGWFLDGGRLAEESIRWALERAGTSLDERVAILDFGCGCGRVIRRLARVPGSVHGSDLNADAVAWCRANLPFGRFEQNGLAPPLAYTDGQFDLVYALSVFTHLPLELQHAWVDELERVLQPGGFLLLTTHGERYLERLRPDERAAFTRGEVVVRFERVAGTNLCTTFHPPAYVVGTLRRSLELVDAVPEGAKGNPHQDLFLLRKPAVT